DPTHHACRHDPPPHAVLDHSDGAQCRRRHVRSAPTVPLPAARQGCEILCGLRHVLASEGIRSLKLPAHSPNLNAFAERWVRSVKQECLSRLILFGEPSLQRALSEFIAHYHSERNHQGKQNVLLFPAPAPAGHRPPIRCRERLGGLLRYYCRAA